jgi:hypothetical protein
VTIIAAWVIAAIAVGLVMSWDKRRYSGSHYLDRGRYATVSATSKQPLTLAIQIVCGDCAGDSERPIRTVLDQSGSCYQCGGASYVLASELARNARRPERHLRVVRSETDRRRTKLRDSRQPAGERRAAASRIHREVFG